MGDWLYYLLIAFIVINGISLIRQYLGQDTIVEGLESRKNKEEEESSAPVAKRPELIVGNTENHNLNLHDQRGDYEKMIIKMDDNVGTAMTKMLGEHSVAISKDPFHPESQRKMQALTTMSNFRNTLNESMKYIDSRD
tara:strand:- start:413 stop:826 length:414 start_codon:yes stop_codon:yes gene_type:complete